MTTLTRAKNMTRTASIGLGAALALYIVVRVGLNIVFALNTNRQVAQQQAKQSQPAVAYGQITAPQLQPAAITTATSSLQLDLVDGAFPESTTSARVYKVAAPSLSLTAQDRARSRGASLGFSQTPDQPNTSTFSWADAWRQLTINLTNQTFSLTTNLPQVDFSQRSLFTQFTSLGQPATTFGQQLFGYTDMQFTNPIIRYVNPAGSFVLPQAENAVKPTNFAQITFLRQSLNALPVYAATGKFGPISLVIVPPMKTTANNSTVNNQIKLDQVVQLSSQYFPIDSKQSSSYPIIDAQAAYNQLKPNLGQYLVSVEPTGTVLPKTLLSARVLFATLVYLEPDARNTQYVQPVWMFEGRATTNLGDASWVAYVPAINQTATKQIVSTK
jgi:hypothetical protein